MLIDMQSESNVIKQSDIEHIYSTTKENLKDSLKTIDIRSF